MYNLLKNRKIHDSPFPYFSAVYMTLVSAFQALVFGGIILESTSALKIDAMTLPLALEYIISILIALIVWHKYVNHHQIIGWQITLTDTFIVVIFGIMQGAMIASLGKEWALNISIHAWLVLFALLGAFAYWHAKRQLNNEYVKYIFIEHHKKQNGSVTEGESIFYAMVGFEDKSLEWSLIFAYVFVVITVFSGITEYKSFFLFLTILCLFFWGYLLDLNSWFNEKKWGELIAIGRNKSKV